MIISIADWIFSVDPDTTAEYCASVVSDPCDCGYCRNFRSAVNAAAPGLNPFLSGFGSRVDAPEELMPFEPTVYEASYCISGSILQKGTQPIILDGVCVVVLSSEETDYETRCPDPWFVLRCGYLELPWVLSEDMDQVVSPANEPEYLQRMWTRLLENASEDTFRS